MPTVVKRKLATPFLESASILACFKNLNWWRLQATKDSVVLISLFRSGHLLPARPTRCMALKQLILNRFLRNLVRGGRG